jgi:hypothetical protein
MADEKKQMIQNGIRQLIDDVIIPVAKESIGNIYTPASDVSLREYANDELDKVFAILPMDTQFLGLITCRQSLRDIILYTTNQSKALLYEKDICPVDEKTIVSQQTNEDRLEKAYTRVIQKVLDHLRTLPQSASLFSVPISLYTTPQLRLAIRKGYNALLTYLLKTSVDGSYLAVLSSGAAIYRIYTADKPKKKHKKNKDSSSSSFVVPFGFSKEENLDKQHKQIYSKKNLRFLVMLPADKSIPDESVDLLY